MGVTAAALPRCGVEGFAARRPLPAARRKVPRPPREWFGAGQRAQSAPRLVHPKAQSLGMLLFDRIEAAAWRGKQAWCVPRQTDGNQRAEISECERTTGTSAPEWAYRRWQVQRGWKVQKKMEGARKGVEQCWYSAQSWRGGADREERWRLAGSSVWRSVRALSARPREHKTAGGPRGCRSCRPEATPR